MGDVLDYMLAVVGHSLALGVVAVSLYRGAFRRYSYVSLYAVALLVFDLTRYVVLYKYGFTSKPYFYVYFGTDVALAILLYLLVLGFFDMVFRDSPLREAVRLSLKGVFALLVFLSYLLISSSLPHFYSHVLVELQQNLYFASVVLTAILCISLVHLRVKDPQLGLLISGVGVVGAMQAVTFAFQNLLPKNLFEALGEVTRRTPALATAVMLGVWCYALWKLPVTARVPAAEPVAAEPEAETEPVLTLAMAAGRGRH